MDVESEFILPQVMYFLTFLAGISDCHANLIGVKGQ